MCNISAGIKNVALNERRSGCIGAGTLHYILHHFDVVRVLELDETPGFFHNVLELLHVELITDST